MHYVPIKHYTKELIYLILRYYLNKEGYELNDRKYYIFDPFESDNDSFFDIRSKYKRIGILSSLGFKEIQVVFYLFKILFDDKDYYLGSGEILTIEESISDDSIVHPRNYESWIQILEKYAEQMNIDQDGNQSNQVRRISTCEYSYSEIYASDVYPQPIVEKNSMPLSPYSRFKQKIYTVEEIIQTYFNDRLFE